MELLSPAGNFEKMQAAVRCGADAVYFGGEMFGLRAKAGNFTLQEIDEAMKFLHTNGKKGYLTLNSFLRDYQIAELDAYIRKVAETGVDAFIISDPGVFSVAKKAAPQIPRHISTQANTTNSAAVSFWSEMGAERVILARELSKSELESITANKDCQIEIFGHGAICISYSGRCLMSAYMTGRDANRGECTQPCRWNYSVTEKTRPGQNMDIEEDSTGTYLYNAKDLCLIDKVGELLNMGISSLKIEGRMKSVMYVAVVTAVYRKAIDEAMKNPLAFRADDKMKRLLSSVSNRHYTEGFYSGVKHNEALNYETSAYVRTTDFLGVAENKDGKTFIDCRGRFETGEELVFLTPALEELTFKLAEIYTAKGDSVDYTKPGQSLYIPLDFNVPEGSILRRELQ